MESDNSYLETMNILFESLLKPLKSKYARAIFNIFLEYKNKEYLTTMDIQEGLSPYQIMLSKKEINAWLKSLNSSFLISKGLERGKPTTIDYGDRYTYDKWSITSKGVLLSTGLKVLRDSIEGNHEISHNDIYPNHSILSFIHSSNGSIELDHLKEVLLNQQGFKKTLEDLKNQGYILERKEDRSIISKLLSSIGVPMKVITTLILTDEGNKALIILEKGQNN